MNKDTKKTISFVLWGIGCAAMIIAGIYAFFMTGAVSSVISAVLGIIALVTAVITFGIRLNEKKSGSPMKLDWVMWLLIAVLLFKTNLFSAIGGIIFFVLGILLILTAVNSIITSLGSNTKISGIIYGVVLGVLGIYLFLHSRAVFDSVISKVIGAYLVVHGIYLANDLIGRIKYSRNFRGVE